MNNAYTKSDEFDVDEMDHYISRRPSLAALCRFGSECNISEILEDVFVTYVTAAEEEEEEPNIYAATKPLYSVRPTPGSISFMITEFKQKLNEFKFRITNFPSSEQFLDLEIFDLFRRYLDSSPLMYGDFVCTEVDSWSGHGRDILFTFTAKEDRDDVFNNLRRNLWLIQREKNADVDICDELIQERVRIMMDARVIFKETYVFDGGVHIRLNDNTYRMVTFVQYQKFLRKYIQSLGNITEEDEMDGN